MKKFQSMLVVGGGTETWVPGTWTPPPLPVVPPPVVPPSTSIPPVDQVLTLAEATAQCTLDGISQLLQPQAFQTCLNNYMNP